MKPSSEKKRMLDQREIEAAVHEVVARARDAGVPVALAGGVALQRLGSTRFTADVDFLAARLVPGFHSNGRLTFGGITTETADGVPLDLIVRDDDFQSLYDEALEYARQDVDGVPVVGAEYIAAMKLQAQRTKDKADLEWIVTAEAIDFAKARRIVKRLLGAYAAQDFDRVVEEARWLASRGRT